MRLTNPCYSLKESNRAKTNPLFCPLELPCFCSLCLEKSFILYTSFLSARYGTCCLVWISFHSNKLLKYLLCLGLSFYTWKDWTCSQQRSWGQKKKGSRGTKGLGETWPFKITDQESKPHKQRTKSHVTDCSTRAGVWILETLPPWVWTQPQEKGTQQKSWVLKILSSNPRFLKWQ